MPMRGQGLMAGLNEGMNNFLNAYVKMKELKNSEDRLAQDQLNKNVDLELKKKQLESAEYDRNRKDQEFDLRRQEFEGKQEDRGFLRDEKEFGRAKGIADVYQKMAAEGNSVVVPEDQRSLLVKHGLPYEFKSGNKAARRALGDELLGLKIEEARRTTGGMSGSVSDLRKEYMGNPTTKATQDVSTAYEKIQNAAKSPSAAGDMSLIYGFMRMQDPGSTVREGEFATAQNAGGVSDTIRNAYNKAISGERLNPKQRQDFMNQAGNIYKAQLTQQKRLDDSYTKLSSEYGFKPDLVVQRGLFQEPQAQAPQPGGMLQEDPKIASYAKQHGLDYGTAQQILIKRGYGK